MEATTARRDDFTRNSISLALTICFTALYTMNEGRCPDDEALEETAESWPTTPPAPGPPT
jgi:hypothetical protein